MPLETSVQAKARAPQKRTPNSMKARAKLWRKLCQRDHFYPAVGKATSSKFQKKIVSNCKACHLLWIKVAWIHKKNCQRTNLQRQITNGRHDWWKGHCKEMTEMVRNLPWMSEMTAKRCKTSRENFGRLRGDTRSTSMTKVAAQMASVKSQEEKLDNVEQIQVKKAKEKKEKIGALFFLCSMETKLYCFNYHVMGVPGSQKDVALGCQTWCEATLIWLSSHAYVWALQGIFSWRQETWASRFWRVLSLAGHAFVSLLLSLCCISQSCCLIECQISGYI